jgi:hypothetical protein
MPAMSDAAYTLITSRSAFHNALREAFRTLADAPARNVFLSDLDFADWPLNDAGVVDELTRWARPHRRLTLLAGHFDEFARRHARWVAWRRTWSHVVDCQAADEADLADVATQFLIPGVLVVRLVDRVAYRGSASRSEADLTQAQDLLDAILQRSQASFPATTLGL